MQESDDLLGKFAKKISISIFNLIQPIYLELAIYVNVVSYFLPGIQSLSGIFTVEATQEKS